MSTSEKTSGGTAGATQRAAIQSEATLETSRLLLELIHAAHATRDRDNAPLAGHGTGTEVSPHAIRAAIHVHQHGDRTVSELAAGLGISLGWASRVVGELEAADLAVRATDQADRRVVHVSLTPQARAIVESVYRWRGDAVERALEGLDEREREAVRAFLRRIVIELGPSSAGH